MATVMATSREVAYARIPLVLSKRFRWTSPTLGRALLVVAEFVLVMVLCFYKMNPEDQWQWEDMGYRTGFIALSQLPIVFLLAGKNNIIGFLIGSSYERLSWLHRWTARILFLTVTIHMGFWFRSWARYNFIKHKLTQDLITQRGFAAWCILLWILLSSFAPIRRWNYEFFVIQHLITLTGFIAAVYLHVPSEVKIWVWIPIGLAIADRFSRSLFIIYNNLSLFHPKSSWNGLWACKATFEPLGSDMTRIVISNPPRNWTAGQHVMLSCHSIAPLQSHPFTIASIPQDGKMEFLVKSKSGGSKRFLKHARKYQTLPLTNDKARTTRTTAVAIEGPYGHVRSLRQFDSVILIAGSSGGTFTVPLMRDIVCSWKADSEGKYPANWLLNPVGTATRHIRFIWVVKSKEQLGWFAAQLSSVAQDVEQLNSDGHEFQVDMSIYVTCDENLEADTKVLSPSTKSFTGYSKPEAYPKLVAIINEKEKTEHSTISPHSTSLSSESQLSGGQGCTPNNTCCCTNTIEEEDKIASSDDECPCHCGNEKPEAREITHDTDWSRSSTASSLADPKKMAGEAIHSAITILSGRPRPKHLVRKTVEQALGESAVVVCGPQGLVNDVRHSVLTLSDERAVHKGTGAQGIYLHTEAFDY